MPSKVFGATLMDFDPLIQRKRERFEQLECEIADPKLFDNRKRAGETMREHANIKTVLAKWDELENARKQLDDNRELATSRDVEIAAMADDEIIDRLTAVRGVGRWTAEMLLIFRLGRPDVWPVTDYGVRKGYARVFSRGRLPSPKLLDQRGEQWRPYRTAAAWYLWRAAETPAGRA